jgi:ABC-2 type transport system ATP-binding protein
LAPLAAEMERVHKVFGATRALDGLDLCLDRGEILALLGPNGAGKTTAVSILTGLRRPDSGRVALLGGRPDDLATRRRIGLTPQESGFPPALRVHEIVRLIRSHFPEPLTDTALFERFPLEAIWKRQAGGLSGGQKRMLAVAMAFAGNPDLVFLDKPTTGLDVEARRALWRSIRVFRDHGGTVVLTTHYLEEAEALASRIVVIHRGKAVADGSVEAIRREVGQARVSYRGPDPDGLPGAVRAERNGEHVVVLASNADVFVRALVERGIPFVDLEVRPASLEEAFVEITGGAEG